MNWSGPIDAYCERLGPGFWAEPFNALTNLAFLLAAAYGLRLARRTGDRPLLVLAGLAAAVGVGSFLFHTLATRWAGMADVIPIVLFIALAFALALHRRVGLPVWGAVAATLAFFAATPAVAGLAAPLLGSSAGYLPALAALLAVGGGVRAAGRPGGGALMGAGAVFALSLSLRMADLAACAAWPYGTHAGWHVLNALVLALVMRALLRDPGRGRS